MNKTDMFHSGVWAVVVMVLISFLVPSCNQRGERYQRTMQECMRTHSPLECEKAVHW